MTPYELIEQYKAEKGLDSDRQAAMALGISPAAVCKIKTDNGIGHEVAWQIAETLKIDPAEVIALCELERAKRSGDEGKIQVWKRRFNAISHSAASLFLGGALLAQGVESVRHCILC